MIRRDFIQAEIAKIAQALAKIMGLKEASQNQEASDLISNTLLHDFNFSLNKVNSLEPAEFKKLLETKNYPKEKLDLLSKFLLESVSPFQNNTETILLLKNVLAIYQMLEQVHHTQSFENLNQQQTIIQFLNKTNG